MKMAETPAVRLTENAATQIRDMLSRESGNAGKRLRVYVERGGCSGLQYGLVFDTPREGDLESTFGEVGVLVDADSARYMAGSVIDYSDDLNQGGFKITNPHARQSCGCGNSFEA